MVVSPCIKPVLIMHNSDGLPYWPLYDESKPTVMQFNNGASLITQPNTEKIALIGSFFNWLRKTMGNQSK